MSSSMFRSRFAILVGFSGAFSGVESSFEPDGTIDYL